MTDANDLVKVCMTKKKDKILEICRKTGALLRGHFRLTSGLHSGHYLQCAKALQYPEFSEFMCKELAGPFKHSKISVVAAPAIGGIIVAYEIARILKARTIFAEREDGGMSFRRGFSLTPKDRVLVVEDVMTTGGSIKEVINLVKISGAKVMGVGVLFDRSPERIDLGTDYKCLLRLNIETFTPDKCPLCEEKIEITKPGSRKV